MRMERWFGLCRRQTCKNGEEVFRPQFRIQTSRKERKSKVVWQKSLANKRKKKLNLMMRRWLSLVSLSARKSSQGSKSSCKIWMKAPLKNHLSLPLTSRSMTRTSDHRSIFCSSRQRILRLTLWWRGIQEEFESFSNTVLVQTRERRWTLLIVNQMLRRKPLNIFR